MEAAKKIKTAGEILLKMLLVAVFIMPFYIAVVYALKSPEETMKTGLAFPKKFYWQNFTEAVEVSNFWNAAKNSLIITVVSVVVLMVVCSMAAYVIARNMRSRFFQSFYYVFLAAMMLPFQVVVLPLDVEVR